MNNEDCYIDIWRDADFRGESLRLYGPAEFAHLRFAQGDWGDQVGSLRVGPRAFVLAYRDRDFKDKQVTFGPNDEVADLRQWKFDDDIDSVQLIDSLKIFDRLLGRDSSAPADAAQGPPAREEARRGQAALKRAPGIGEAEAGRSGVRAGGAKFLLSPSARPRRRPDPKPGTPKPPRSRE